MGMWRKLRRRSTREIIWEIEAEHRTHLRKAAGIGRVDLRCHKDTWAHFVAEFEKTKHNHDSAAFRPPAEADIKDEGDGMLLVPLSGNTLAALLDRCRKMCSAHYSDLDTAIGGRVQTAITTALAKVEPKGDADDPAVIIVLDDRPKAVTDAAQA
ncbi:hypothetical protein BX261_7246 [Streptomyces sp. 2321.6]|uniref:hypothetical protein n=1 Tax=Streptomyces sp. 2321.6 TaxID=1938840 RepID=UPI000BB14B7E|nr:hypothetical protein [Streptomyces sp. 2321.6]PBC72373.1 hypothetical protein BX261_7246 [Streptomyces sp. 2321.6]